MNMRKIKDSVNIHVANYNCVMREKQDAESVKEVLARILYIKRKTLAESLMSSHRVASSSK